MLATNQLKGGSDDTCWNANPIYILDFRPTQVLADPTSFDVAVTTLAQTLTSTPNPEPFTLRRCLRTQPASMWQ